MIIDIAPKFYSAISLPYNLQVKVTDLEILCCSFTAKFLRSFIYSAACQIILVIFGIQIAAMEDVHPKLYPVPCLPYVLVAVAILKKSCMAFADMQ